ncbi:hypothetical protein [Streptococcus intermedius]|nr:hypothetical protein [Streptococcus intermedius]
MKRFSGHTLVSDLEGGLTGKTADSAKSYLRNIARPQLQSPIKV